MKILLFVIVTIVLIPIAMPSFDIKLIEKNRIDQKDVIIQRTYSFAVTEDEIILIADDKASNIKLYNNKGKLLRVWGRRGMGPNEFVRPMQCDYRKGKFAVSDSRKYKIFIYNRTGKTDFKLSTSLRCLSPANDMHLDKDGIYLLAAGFKRDKSGTPYSCYIVDFVNKKTILLLPTHLVYGFTSYDRYKKEYFNKPDITAIGIGTRCDWYGDYVYFTWVGDLNIIKKNITNGEVSFFGKKTPYYIQPHASKKLIKEYNISIQTRNGRKCRILKRKMSYIRRLIAGKDFVGLIYGNEDENSRWYFTVQFYDHDGKFLDEKQIYGLYPGSRSFPFFFRRDSNELYYLYHTVDDESEDVYEMQKYKIFK